MTYLEKTLQYALDRNLTAQQVRTANYRLVATASDITLDANGNPPRDYHYRNIRHRVAAQLERIREESAGQARKAAILTKVKTLTSEADARVEYVREDETVAGPCIVIRRGK